MRYEDEENYIDLSEIFKIKWSLNFVVVVVNYLDESDRNPIFSAESAIQNVMKIKTNLKYKNGRDEKKDE